MSVNISIDKINKKLQHYIDIHEGFINDNINCLFEDLKENEIISIVKEIKQYRDRISLLKELLEEDWVDQ